jgi:hypothetical protein
LRILLRLSLSLLLVLLAYAFPVRGDSTDELPLSLTISGPQTVNVGDVVIIHAVVKNVSKRTIRVSFGKPYTVLIHNENSKEPSRKPGVWAGSSASGDVQPGEAVEDFLTNLTSEYDLSLPGKYFVLFRRRLYDNDPKSLILESNEITITVRQKIRTRPEISR